MGHNITYLGATMALCFTVIGCADEIDVYETHVYETPAEQDPALLIGSWEWPVEVSRLEVDADLRATQTSDFDTPGAAPSTYTMIPINDGVLVLEGWLANATCEPDVACHDGRVYQRHTMSYYVDEERFMPFALVRKSGDPGTVGGAGAGLFEGFGVEATRLAVSGAGGDDVFRTIETRWRLSLDADGAWSIRTQSIDLDGDGAPFEDTVDRGTWTIAEDGGLTLDSDDGSATRHTMWKGDVVALDGLIFERRP